MTIQSLMMATKAARQRLNDDSIGVHVKVGQYQVVSVTYPSKRKSIVKPLSDWVSLDDAITYLRSL